MLVGLLFPGTTVSLKSDKVLENIPVVAHRGASKDAPENTLPAFEKAWLQGADAIEGDFHLTADNEIVCVHDANIRHYTQKDIEVRDLTLAELKKLDFGRWHDKQFAGTRIPTFKEVVATIPKGKRIFIEIKSDAQLVPHLIHQIRNSSLELQQIVIISFHKDVIKACLLYTSPSPRDRQKSRMPSSA